MSDELIEHCPAAFINAIADEGTKEEAVRHLQETWNELCAAEKKAESLQTELSELKAKHQGLLSWVEGAKLDNEGLQAKVEELDGKLRQFVYCENNPDDPACPPSYEELEARLAKYEDNVLPKEVARQVERLRLQCIWQRMRGTDRDNGYPYYKHLPDCDICRSADLIERLSREKP